MSDRYRLGVVLPEKWNSDAETTLTVQNYDIKGVVICD